MALALECGTFASKLYSICLVPGDKFPENMYPVWRGKYWQQSILKPLPQDFPARDLSTNVLGASGSIP
jgi:hypothetical protein